jgi:hypothetical protein
MKKALPVIIPILFLSFLIPTTTVSANDGDGGKKSPLLHRTPDSVRPKKMLLLPPVVPGSSAGHNSWWDNVKQFFGEDSKQGGEGFSGESGGTSSASSSAGSGAPSAPIDGGISLLLAAGIGLGIKKARSRHKNIHQQTRTAG